ncbi:MAG: glycoside hydrolase family 15 protein [Candidatus Binatia bacterium]
MNDRATRADLDLALVGNCQFSSLIDPRGRVVWTCFPRFDSPSVFASLLDQEKGGTWTIEGSGAGWCTDARYVENTCVLCTRWYREDASEAFEVIDFAPRFFQNDRYYHPTMLVRIVRPLSGRPRVRIDCSPRFDYGLREPRVARGSNHVTWEDPQTMDRLRLTTNASITGVTESLSMELSTDLYFALAWDEPFETSFNVLEDFLIRTCDYWRRWCKRTRIPVNYQDAVLRAAMTLKLHTFHDTGAVIAATTTSIPEAMGTSRTWDYRYCWVRDAAFVVRSLLRMGHSEDAERFCEYLRNLLPVDRDDEFVLQPVYGIDGRRELTERSLDHLAGYRGHGPVRVGNDAYTHAQNDVYGEVVLALAPLFYDARLLGSELEPVYEAIDRLVSASIRTFPAQDSSIWEYRERSNHHVFSKFMAWVAVDRASRIAERTGHPENLAEWGSEAKRMKAEIIERGYCAKTGSFVDAYGSTRLDASLLLMPILGFLPPDDPRTRSTIDTMKERLSRNGYVFRYRHEDDFGEQKAAFTICATWMVEALWIVGRYDEARAMFERLLETRNRFGLLSEDIDPSDAELWGNFPQTYSMLGLINCAVRLSPRWDEIF